MSRVARYSRLLMRDSVRWEHLPVERKLLIALSVWVDELAVEHAADWCQWPVQQGVPLYCFERYARLWL